MNLPKTQLGVIQRMRDGWKWHSCECPFCRPYLVSKKGFYHITQTGIYQLIKKGLIKTRGNHDYVLTEKALQVLREKKIEPEQL